MTSEEQIIDPDHGMDVNVEITLADIAHTHEMDDIIGLNEKIAEIEEKIAGGGGGSNYFTYDRTGEYIEYVDFSLINNRFKITCSSTEKIAQLVLYDTVPNSDESNILVLRIEDNNFNWEDGPKYSLYNITKSAEQSNISVELTIHNGLQIMFWVVEQNALEPINNVFTFREHSNNNITVELTEVKDKLSELESKLLKQTRKLKIVTDCPEEVCKITLIGDNLLYLDIRLNYTGMLYFEEELHGDTLFRANRQADYLDVQRDPLGWYKYIIVAMEHNETGTKFGVVVQEGDIFLLTFETGEYKSYTIKLSYE